MQKLTAFYEVTILSNSNQTKNILNNRFSLLLLPIMFPSFQK